MIGPLESRIIPAITFSIMAVLYILNPSPIAFFVTLLFLTGLAFSAAALVDGVFSDMTWAVTAGGSAYWGLSIIAPHQLGLAVALTVTLIPFIIPLSNQVEEWGIDGWGSYYPVVLTVVAIGGVYLGLNLTPWIIMSPFLELAMYKAPIYRGETTYSLWGVYYAVIYALSLSLNPILVLYIASLSIARLSKPGLGELKAVPLDSLVRLLLGVATGWIIGL